MELVQNRPYDEADLTEMGFARADDEAKDNLPFFIKGDIKAMFAQRDKGLFFMCQYNLRAKGRLARLKERTHDENTQEDRDVDYRWAK
jgi:hypothetical protein|tara:strand:- start:266 stop:529 length:264 start_codon:yes stop_codon:yes gene_type:complete